MSRFRWWLIRRLVGDHTVCINARIYGDALLRYDVEDKGTDMRVERMKFENLLSSL